MLDDYKAFISEPDESPTSISEANEAAANQSLRENAKMLAVPLATQTPAHLSSVRKRTFKSPTSTSGGTYNQATAANQGNTAASEASSSTVTNPASGNIGRKGKYGDVGGRQVHAKGG